MPLLLCRYNYPCVCQLLKGVASSPQRASSSRYAFYRLQMFILHNTHPMVMQTIKGELLLEREKQQGLDT